MSAKLVPAQHELDDLAFRLEEASLDGRDAEIRAVAARLRLGWADDTEPEPEPAPLVFVDAETDGIHYKRYPWEIALIRRDPGGAETEHRWLVELPSMLTSDPYGLRVGRFYERHPRGRALAGLPALPGPGCVDPWMVARDIVALTHGAHWVGAVPDFDTKVIQGFLAKHGQILPAWHYHLIDIENLAVGYLAGKGHVLHPPWSSDQLAAALELDPGPAEQRHTALGDARFVRSIYDRVMGGA